MKKISLFIFFSIAFFCDASSQTPDSISMSEVSSLPTDSILFQSLAAYHQQLTAAELQEFEVSNSGQWMTYLPSVGVGYTPAGQPRPTASFSLSQVLTAKRNKQTLAAKRRAITESAMLRHANDKRHLTGLIRQFDLLKRELEFEKELFQIDTELFEFYQAQLENHELTASQFLLKKKSYLTTKNDLFRLEVRLEEKKTEVLEAARLGMF